MKRVKNLEVPDWFNPELVPLLKKKIERSNIKDSERALDWMIRQVLKSLPSKLTGVKAKKKFTWNDIEGIIEDGCNAMEYEPDIVIGIKSGGAFIADYVAKCLNIPTIDYMHISHYSDNSRSVVKSTLTSLNKKAIIKEGPKVEVKSKKVLLVDDQTATGSTLDVGVAYMKEEKVKEVKTFCLYSKDGDIPNLDFYKEKGVMLYTPWGKDA